MSKTTVKYVDILDLIDNEKYKTPKNTREIDFNQAVDHILTKIENFKDKNNK